MSYNPEQLLQRIRSKNKNQQQSQQFQQNTAQIYSTDIQSSDDNGVAQNPFLIPKNPSNQKLQQNQTQQQQLQEQQQQVQQALLDFQNTAQFSQQDYQENFHLNQQQQQQLQQQQQSSEQDPYFVQELLQKNQELESYVQNLQYKLMMNEQEKNNLEEQMVNNDQIHSQSAFQQKQQQQILQLLNNTQQKKPVHSNKKGDQTYKSPYSQKNLQNQSKSNNKINLDDQQSYIPTGKLNLEPLQQILTENPQLTRPTITIEITEEDLLN